MLSNPARRSPLPPSRGKVRYASAGGDEAGSARVIGGGVLSPAKTHVDPSVILVGSLLHMPRAPCTISTSISKAARERASDNGSPLFAVIVPVIVPSVIAPMMSKSVMRLPALYGLQNDSLQCCEPVCERCWPWLQN